MRKVGFPKFYIDPTEIALGEEHKNINNIKFSFIQYVNTSHISVFSSFPNFCILYVVSGSAYGSALFFRCLLKYIKQPRIVSTFPRLSGEKINVILAGRPIVLRDLSKYFYGKTG